MAFVRNAVDGGNNPLEIEHGFLCFIRRDTMLRYVLGVAFVPVKLCRFVVILVHCAATRP